MHELGMCEAILAAALTRADGRRVREVRVRIGGHPVDPEVINQNVQIAAIGTLAEGVHVDVVMEPAVLRCRSCGHEASADDHLAMVACRECGALDIEVSGSDQLVLESIVVDVPAEEVPAEDVPAETEGSGAWTPSNS